MTFTLRNLTAAVMMALALLASLAGSVHLAGASPAGSSTTSTTVDPCTTGPVCGGGIIISAQRVSHDPSLNIYPGQF